MRRSKTEPDDSAARHLSVDELRTSGRAAIAPSSQGDLIKGSDRSAFRSGGERGRPLDAQNPQPAKDRSGEVLADEMRAVKERADLKSEAVVEEGTAPFFVRRYRFVPPIRDTSDPPRTEFHDLLYWDPLVVTDEHGRATIEFDLPAVVTRFRVMAEGHGSSRIGEALHILQTGSAN